MTTRSICQRRAYLSFSTSVVAVFVALSTAVSPRLAHAQNTLVVDDDGKGTATNCDAGAPAFSSIQAAVNEAAPGDTIFICPGVYSEQVVVTTPNLTIRGSGVGVTILRPATVVQNTFRPGSGAPVAPIVLVDGAAGVTIAMLTVDGSVADSGRGIFSCAGAPFYVGVYYRVSSGTVDAAHITNVMSAVQCSFGILGQTDQSGFGGVANVAVTNSLIDRYGVGGVACIGQNTTCTVTRNTIRGEGPVSDLGQLGILIRAEAGGRIAGNVITDHAIIGAHGVPQSAVGVFLFFARSSSNPHVVRDNIFARNQIDVQRNGSAAAFD